MPGRKQSSVSFRTSEDLPTFDESGSQSRSRGFRPSVISVGTDSRRSKLDSISSFLSSSNREESVSESLGTDDSSSKSQDPEVEKKIRIIRKLLKGFSLEDTIDHYRSLDSATYTLNPYSFSYDCTMPAARARARLIELTGTDKVHVNDYNYMKKMEEKVLKEYEEEQIRKEKHIAELERERLRRLMVHGYISPEELREELAEHKLESSSRQELRQPKEQTGERRGKQKIESPRKTTVSRTSTRSQPEKQIKPKSTPTRYKNPLMESMEHVETVDGLYDIAERLVHPHAAVTRD